jgi:hypothetical protein
LHHIKISFLFFLLASGLPRALISPRQLQEELRAESLRTKERQHFIKEKIEEHVKERKHQMAIVEWKAFYARIQREGLFGKERNCFEKILHYTKARELKEAAEVAECFLKRFPQVDIEYREAKPSAVRVARAAILKLVAEDAPGFRGNPAVLHFLADENATLDNSYADAFDLKLEDLPTLDIVEAPHADGGFGSASTADHEQAPPNDAASVVSAI